VVTAFSEQFNKGMPQKATLLDWQKCAFALWRIKDRLWSRWRKKYLTTCAVVSASTDCTSQKLTRKQSAGLGVPWSTMQDYMKDLNLLLYPLKFTNEQLDVDMNWHCWTLSWIPHPAWRFPLLVSAQFIAIPMTEMLCFGL
jgi:hypothetical protein